MMTPEREAEIRQRCERATPGPWRKIKNISGDFDIGTELSRAVPRVALEDGLEKWREAAEWNREIDEAQYRGW